MSKRVAVLQSNYIPWRGYFDIIGLADEFVIYDVVQFTKNDWRNRNRIKTPQGPIWLTIPVATAGRLGQSIAQTRIADRNWAARHWRSISQAYARAPHFERYRQRLAAAFEACGQLEWLSAVNRALIETVAAELGLATRISSAADMSLEGDRTQRLVGLCRALGAGVYVSGPRGRNYLDVGLFHDAGIAVEFVDYSGYSDYPQLHGAFEPAVSVLDLLFNTGPLARSYMLCGPTQPPPAPG